MVVASCFLPPHTVFALYSNGAFVSIDQGAACNRFAHEEDVIKSELTQQRHVGTAILRRRKAQPARDFAKWLVTTTMFCKDPLVMMHNTLQETKHRIANVGGKSTLSYMEFPGNAALHCSHVLTTARKAPGVIKKHGFQNRLCLRCQKNEPLGSRSVLWRT